MQSDDQQRQDEWRLAVAAPAALDLDPSGDARTVVIEEPRFLFFRCAGAECAVPLAALREVLPQCPAALPLPHSPEWLLGIFALRAELVGLADPAPLLLGAAADHVSGPPVYGAALLVGTGAHVLAWAVESIGATTPLMSGADDDANTGAPAEDAVPGELVTPPLTMASPYAAGMIALATGRRCTLIHADMLLADMLRALEERPAVI